MTQQSNLGFFIKNIGYKPRPYDNLVGCDGMGWRFKGEETYVLYGTYLQLIHVDEWQKPTQFYKAIFFPLKINF